MRLLSSPLAAAIALAAGIALAPHLPVPVPGPVLWIVAVILGIGAIRWRPLAIGALVAVGMGRGVPHAPVVPAGATPDDRSVDRIVGTVGGPVVPGAHGLGAPVDTGDTVVWVWSDDAPLVPGQRVAVTGLVHAPRGFLDPGVPDRVALMASRGADWEMTAQGVDVLADDPGPVDLAWRAAAAAQARWARRVGDPALAGIALGDRGEVPPALDQRWRIAGIYHVLSVSGLHLAVVAGLAFSLLRRLVAASPWGGRTRPARWAAPPALVLAIAYTLVTGAQLATLRCLVVIALVMIAAAIDRPVRLVDALGAAALALGAWGPCALYDPSLQRWVVAALTLARLPAMPRPAGAGRVARAWAWVRRGVVSSAWVALTTAPITAYHFHQVSIGGIAGNLVLTPAVELVALPMALAGLAIGEVIAPVGDALVAIAAGIVGVVDDLAGLLARVAPLGTIGVASTTAMAILVMLSLWLAGGGRARWLAWIALCAAWTRARLPAPAGALRVTFLDVGQGDAAIVELPDGATWLVDAGGTPGARDLAGATAPGRAIDATLAVYGRTRVDLAIVSHPHPDHYLGLAGMQTPIDELWAADEPEPHAVGDLPAQPSFHTVVDKLRVAHPPLGVARSEAGVELVVWAPRMDGREQADPVRTVNDNSLVIAIRYRNRTVLFSGDVEAEGEDLLVAAGLPHADVVKVPHHGSPTSSTAVFVDATRPALAVISCGLANRFGFPAPAVVARWQAAGAAVARTDRDGAVTVTIDEAGDMDVARTR